MGVPVQGYETIRDNAQDLEFSDLKFIHLSNDMPMLRHLIPDFRNSAGSPVRLTLNRIPI